MASDASLFLDLRAKVWAIADSKRQGYLGFAEFVIAMQVRPHSCASVVACASDNEWCGRAAALWTDGLNQIA